MNGWIKLQRNLFESKLWHDVVPFRLYLWIAGHATHKDRCTMGGTELKRGQYIRSYAKLAEDLSFKDGRAERIHSKSTIKRAADKLVKKGFITAVETESGMLFTVMQFADFQSKHADADFFMPFNHGTMPEYLPNEQGKNPEAKQAYKKIKNADKQSAPAAMPDHLQGHQRVDAVSAQYIKLRNKGSFLSPKDYASIERIAELDIELDVLLMWMAEIAESKKARYPDDPIRSAAYYEPILQEKLESKQNGHAQKNGISQTSVEALFRKLAAEGSLRMGEMKNDER